MSGEPVPDDAGRIYRRLLGYARPYVGQYLIGVLGMVLYSISNALVAVFAKLFFESASTCVQQGGATDVSRHLFGMLRVDAATVLEWSPLGAILIFMVRGVGDYLANYFPGWVGRQVVQKLRSELYGKYLQLPTSYYDRESSAPMLTRLAYNIELVAEATTSSLKVILQDSITIVLMLALMFWYSWQLAACALLIGPAIGWMIRKVNQRFRRYSTRIQNSLSDVTQLVRESLDAHRMVKVFNAQKHLRADFDDVNEHNRHSNMRLVSARSSASPIVQLLGAIGLAAVLFVANRQFKSGVLTMAEFIAFLACLLAIPQSLQRLVGVASSFQQGVAAGASIFAVLDAPGEPDDGRRALTRASGEVEFRQVDFRYIGKDGPALRNVNLKVRAGTTVAIVGRSGSGKSTLVSLLPRFYDPAAGQLLIDGVDAREYSLHDLRAQISMVSQDIVLFNDTIRNNILFGAEGVGAPEVEAAARAAQVLEFTQALPQGLDTMLGDRGMTVSGGQRQRIAIARALLRNTPILILDEAMSALDTAAERYIQAALDELVRNRTTFVIAHRLSTIEHADLIVVMGEGSIVESGTHVDLLARGGVYAQLHKLQFNV